MTFISKQVEGDSFNLPSRHYVLKRGCYKVLQAIYKQYQILGSKVGHDRAIDLVSGCPMGLSVEKTLPQPDRCLLVLVFRNNWAHCK